MRRTCVITGVSRGIGAEMARYLEEDEYRIIGIGRHRPSDWNGGFIECDLESIPSIRHACTGIEQLGEVFAIVNNAAMLLPDTLVDLAYERMLSTFTVNTFAPALLTQSVIKVMSGPGRILNIGSIASRGRLGRASYGSSKAALMTLTRAWALELAERGITVNALSLGAVDTEMLRGLIGGRSTAESELISRIPCRRLGTTREVAHVVRFLLSPSASYCTGQVIHLDGGSTLGGRIP